jgi:OmpA-OmpF porin, OOP family
MKYMVFLAFVVLLVFCMVVRAQDDQFKDTPYLSGMPNYKIIDAADREFDNYNFFNGKSCTTVEGKKFSRSYTLKEGAKQASDLQVSRNYAAAVRNMGGSVLFEGVCENADCAANCGYQMVVGKILKNNSETWVEVVPFNEGNDYYITIVVKEAMKQDVTASAMLDALNKQGFIALYINFDTGKSTIKPESKPIINQIVELLKSNPDLKLSIEGHTDNVGNPKSNKTLSEERARSIFAAIVAQGIDGARLSSTGHGQDKPLADNSTEEGRAKNRRVDLVKK